MSALLLAGSAAAGPTDAEKCEAAKLKVAGKYNFCLLKAKAKAVKTGNSVDYTKCFNKFSARFAKAESMYSGNCPSSGDLGNIQSQVSGDAGVVALKLSGDSPFVDNGDGTITDGRTGLMWEKKDNTGGIHDWDNLYAWGSESPPYAPIGTAFTTFLATLNGGGGPGTCFAGHCDWRLPTIEELQALLTGQAYDCGADSCIDPIFGLHQPDFYWSATTISDSPSRTWIVDFGAGQLEISTKSLHNYVRAARGGL